MRFNSAPSEDINAFFTSKANAFKPTCTEMRHQALVPNDASKKKNDVTLFLILLDFRKGKI